MILLHTNREPSIVHNGSVIWAMLSLMTSLCAIAVEKIADVAIIDVIILVIVYAGGSVEMV